MGLERYRAKRDLERTPEPGGARTLRKGKGLAFVVQRHKASHLHYDFRLEIRGVLKSWAVPKGPSMDPADKRLAMMVEDHPYDYKDFAGVIPEGNYGAGIVEIWDRGTYVPLDPPEGKDHGTVLMHMLHKGSMKFVLKGRKLKGEFALVHFKKGGENSWLLIKHRDAYAVEGYDSEVHTPKRSPINRALAAEGKAGKGSRKGASKKAGGKTGANKGSKKARSSKVSKKAAPKKAGKKKGRAGDADGERSGGVQATDARRAARPAARSGSEKVSEPVRPMLATLVEEAFDDPDWVFEIKWDGYRAIAETGTRLRSYSRNGISFLNTYPSITEALKQQEKGLVLDGEIVALDHDDRPRFQLLQHAGQEPGTTLVYYVFDLLRLHNKDITHLPLLERKALLHEHLRESEAIRYCDHVVGQGKDFFDLAVEQDLEGIIAKRAKSAYSPGIRSRSWLKIKHHRTQEAVIGGYTAPRGSREHFGALLLGMYDKGALHYVGHTGTGFDQATLAELQSMMHGLERRSSPFAEAVEANAPATWIRPELVCQVKFTEWTREGRMRHPVFLGMRKDKDPRTVEREHMTRTSHRKRTTTTRTRKKAATAKEEGPDEVERRISGHRVQLTNRNKVWWPEEGITKGDVQDYYERMHKVLLPYLKDRPQSLYRTPNGFGKPGFFHKDAGGAAPGWVRSVKVPSESHGGPVDYILCNDAATLLYLVNLGCIELNPWTSRVPHLDRPDHLVMDLDPSDGNTFDDVVEAALAVKVVTDQLKLTALCKTSGSSGIHVYIASGARYTYHELAPMAEGIMTAVHELLPRTTTLQRSLKARGKKEIYLDHLQNRQGQTLASVYSLRPRSGATVSTPMDWKEVRPGLDPSTFNIHTVPARVERKGDLFRALRRKKTFSLKRVLRDLEDLLG